MDDTANQLIDRRLDGQAIVDRSSSDAIAGLPGGENVPEANPQVDPKAREMIDRLSERIARMVDSIHAPQLIKELFCTVLDWQYVKDPVPTTALPASLRENITEAIILAKCDQMPLCYVRLSQSELTAAVERKPLDSLNKAWPGVLVAFGNFGENQIDFCFKTLDGRIIRVSLDRSLFGSADLAQAIYAMRAFDVKTDEPTPQIQVAERLERQLKRMPRRLRTRSRLKGNAFFREIGRHKLLNHYEEKRLRRQYLPGTRHSARDRMILANLRLVVSIAGRYQKRGIGWDDLLQEGILGLMKAADKFDPDKGFRFSTYATWWIMQSITRAIAEQPPLIGTPCYLAENLLKYRRYFKDFIQEHGFIPSDCDICDHFAMSKSEWRIFRQVRSAWFGLRKLDVSMTCRATESPEECASGSECQTFVSGFIADQFDARTAEIMHRRFGIGDRPEETLEMIGQSMKVTRERIRQIEAKAIQTFRDL